MMHARLTFWGENAGELFRALEPDNLPEIIMKVEGGCLRIELSAQKIGTLLSTADDLLMNLKIAEEILASVEER